MKRTVAGFATGVFAVIAIATAPPAAAGPEADFLGALADGGLSVPANANFRVISAGRSVCSGFSSGDSYKDAIAGVAGAFGGNNSLAGTFVSAAVSSFCPKYASELP
jgi:Protein of unknown function (DUF732)